MKLKITFPIVSSYSSEYYALIIIDSASITHYWNFDGSYDGFSCNPCTDQKTGSCLN